MMFIILLQIMLFLPPQLWLNDFNLQSGKDADHPILHGVPV